MKDIQLKKISVDDVYVSILTRTRVTSPEGWTRMEPVAKQKINTGSIIIDAVGQALAEDCRVTSTELARAMHTDTETLGAVFMLLTGMNLREFIKRYQCKRACEWLKCTDIETEEVARRSGLPEALFAPLYKILAITLGVRVGSGLCRDAGEQALASVVETAGAVCALLTALPLLRSVLSMLLELME